MNSAYQSFRYNLCTEIQCFDLVIRIEDGFVAEHVDFCALLQKACWCLAAGV